LEHFEEQLQPIAEEAQVSGPIAEEAPQRVEGQVAVQSMDEMIRLFGVFDEFVALVRKGLHPDDVEKFQKQLDALAEKYKEITGEDMKKYYRPPQGKFSENNLKMAKSLGYNTIFWSLAYADWDNKKQPSSESALKILNERIHPGAVVLLHSTSKTNAEILDELLSGWKDMGYTFASIDELICT